MRSKLPLLLTLGLIGCTGFGQPGFMPDGYARHAEEYKSAPGKESRDIGYNYSAYKNDEVMQIWRIIANDVVDIMQAETGLEPQMIYLEPSNTEDAFHSALDHVLRETLRDRDFGLVSSSFKNILHLTYQAVPVAKLDLNADQATPDMGASTDMLENFEDYLLQVSIFENGALVGDAGGIYRIPTYDTIIRSDAEKNYRGDAIVGRWQFPTSEKMQNSPENLGLKMKTGTILGDGNS